MSTRRSNRQSGISTPAEPAGPTFTASGRQVRSRVAGAYGEAPLSGQQEDVAQIAAISEQGLDESGGQAFTYGRGQRSAGRGAHTRGYNKNFRSYDGTDEDSPASTSGEEWDGGDEDDDADDRMIDDIDEEDLEMSDDEVSAADDEEQELGSEYRRSSLVVSLRYQRKPSPRSSGTVLGHGEPPATNGVIGSSSVAISDSPNQEAQQPFQTFTPQHDPHLQEAKPMLQDSEGNIKEVSLPISETSKTPGSSTFARPVANAPPV